MAKTSTSSARRGRHLVSKDYTSKIRFDAQVRETDRRAKMATAGMIGDFAKKTTELATAIDKNLESWENLEKGAEEVYSEGKASAKLALEKRQTEFDSILSDSTISQGQKDVVQGEIDILSDKYSSFGKEFDSSKIFQDPDDPSKTISKWSQMWNQSPAGKVLRIGDRGFFGEELENIGKMEGASSNMLRKTNKDGETLSLYDSIGGTLYGRDQGKDAEGKDWASQGMYWVADRRKDGGSIFKDMSTGFTLPTGSTTY